MGARYCFGTILILISGSIIGLGSIISPHAGGKEPAQGAGPIGNRILVIVLDGLRPDYVTPEWMPNLYALGESGVVYRNHHSTMPTATRVNSATISTGTYPTSHGLMDNSLYLPDISSGTLSTSSVANLRLVEAETGGNLLTVPSIGEVYNAAGKKILAVSSANNGGSVFLLNHKALGGGVIAVGLIDPDTMISHVIDTLGPVPPESEPNTLRNAWAVDAYLEIGLEEIEPDLTFLWLTDPDHTAHDFGIGAPATIQALQELDGEIGRILAKHTDLGLDDRINILVTADHGFVTRDGEDNLRDLIDKHGFGDDVVVVRNRGLYLVEYSDELAQSIITALQSEPTVGAIYAPADDALETEGRFPGTFSLDAVRWSHERGGDLLVTRRWNDRPNEYGLLGHTASGNGAGHGGDSYFEINLNLYLHGPDFKTGLKIDVPSGHVDISATAYHLQGVSPPVSLEGRVLQEALVGGPAPSTIAVDVRKHEVNAPGYRATLVEAFAAGSRYLSYSRREDSAQYEAWQTAHFGSDLEDSGKEDMTWGNRADPDHDGNPNIAEFFFASDPNLQDTGYTTMFEADEQAFTVIYRRALEADGSMGGPEWSTDLTEWFEDGAVERQLHNLGEAVFIETTIPVDPAQTNVFVRFRIGPRDLPVMEQSP